MEKHAKVKQKLFSNKATSSITGKISPMKHLANCVTWFEQWGESRESCPRGKSKSWESTKIQLREGNVAECSLSKKTNKSFFDKRIHGRYDV